jgi:hypothetical protein
VDPGVLRRFFGGWLRAVLRESSDRFGLYVEIEGVTYLIALRALDTGKLRFSPNFTSSPPRRLRVELPVQRVRKQRGSPVVVPVSAAELMAPRRLVAVDYEPQELRLAFTGHDTLELLFQSSPGDLQGTGILALPRFSKHVP